MMAACHDLNVESVGVWKEVVLPCVSATSVKNVGGCVASQV